MSVVLITGCSSGFGLESALAFARRGHTTYATMRDLAKADTLVARAAAEGLDIELLALDVKDTTSVTSAIGGRWRPATGPSTSWSTTPASTASDQWRPPTWRRPGR